MTKDIGEQVKDLKEDFRAFNEKARTSISSAVLEAAINVERTAKIKVSRGRNEESRDGLPPRVDTGRLRASITHRLKSTATSVYAEIGTNVEYAPGLEFGTSRTWKHPFMQPSLDENAKETERLIEDALGGAVENA